VSYPLFISLMAGGIGAVVFWRDVLKFCLWMLDKWSPECNANVVATTTARKRTVVYAMSAKIFQATARKCLAVSSFGVRTAVMFVRLILMIPATGGKVATRFAAQIATRISR
jgi:hypothetical protein